MSLTLFMSFFVVLSCAVGQLEKTKKIHGKSRSRVRLKNKKSERLFVSESPIPSSSRPLESKFEDDHYVVRSQLANHSFIPSIDYEKQEKTDLAFRTAMIKNLLENNFEPRVHFKKKQPPCEKRISLEKTWKTIFGMEFKVEKVLGKGLFSCVYRVSMQRSGGEKYLFALKIVTLGAQRPAMNIEEASREIALLKSFSKKEGHADFYGAMRLPSSKEKPDLALLFLEYAQKGDAHKDKEFSPEGFYQVLSGVYAMHKRRLFHGDIKPENILVHDDRWTIADIAGAEIGRFGVVRQSTFTRIYTAPEFHRFSELQNKRIASDALKVANLKFVDYSRADAFSLGLTGLSIKYSNRMQKIWRYHTTAALLEYIRLRGGIEENDYQSNKLIKGYIKGLRTLKPSFPDDRADRILLEMLKMDTEARLTVAGAMDQFLTCIRKGNCLK